MPLQAESAIASWQQWHADLHTMPVIVRPLENGRSNRSFLLDSAGRSMVLRLNDSGTLLPAGNRHHESDAWQAASAAGIAPPLIHIDPEAGFLVSTFIDGSLPTQAHTNTATTRLAFDLLRRCHSLQLNTPSLDYAHHIEHYWQLINASEGPVNDSLIRQREPMQVLLANLLQSDPQSGFCHHDPIRANFVGHQQRLYLIDWEYACVGLLVMDYAALGVEWGIEDAIVLAQSGVSEELLAMAKELYQYLCGLWEAARVGGSGALLLHVQEAAELL